MLIEMPLASIAADSPVFWASAANRKAPERLSKAGVATGVTLSIFRKATANAVLTTELPVRSGFFRVPIT